MILANVEMQVHRDVGERGHQRDGAVRGAAEAGHDAAALAAAHREGRDEEEIKVRDHVKNGLAHQSTYFPTI